jgi:hypothetical protein
LSVVVFGKWAILGLGLLRKQSPARCEDAGAAGDAADDVEAEEEDIAAEEMPEPPAILASLAKREVQYLMGQVPAGAALNEEEVCL